jgi:hypothetical protein
MSECFLCGNPLTAGAGVTSIMTHPRGKPGAAMLGHWTTSSPSKAAAGGEACAVTLLPIYFVMK